VEGYSLIIFAETQIYQGLQLIRKTFTHWILRPPRLPIPPLRQVYFNFPLPDPPLELGGTFRRDIKTKTIILFSRTPYYQGLHTPTGESTK